MEIITPKDSVGTLMELCQGRRGDFVDMQFLTETRTTLIYELPLALVSPLHAVGHMLFHMSTNVAPSRRLPSVACLFVCLPCLCLSVT